MSEDEGSYIVDNPWFQYFRDHQDIIDYQDDYDSENSSYRSRGSSHYSDYEELESDTLLDVLQCPFCSRFFDNKRKLPLNLECGHTLCQ